eukprot:IDg4964t1
MDNCEDHNKLPEFNGVTIVLLPENTRAVYKPLDQSLISMTKIKYCSLLLRETIDINGSGYVRHRHLRCRLLERMVAWKCMDCSSSKACLSQRPWGLENGAKRRASPKGKRVAGMVSFGCPTSKLPLARQYKNGRW